MAAKVDAEEQTNTIDPARLKKELARIEEAIAAKESHRMGYVEKCKPFNERIANAYEIASKAAGVPMNVLKAKVKERELHRKIARIGEKLEDDARETFEMVSQALGDFGDLPLGQAAKDRATKAEKSGDAEAPKRPRGRPRKASSPDAPADDASAGLDPIAVAETDDPTYRRGFDVGLAGGGCIIPSELCGLYRDRWHAGYLAGEKQAAVDRAAAQNADALSAASRRCTEGAMKLLALDLSSHTGFAVGEHDSVPTFGTYHLPKTGDDVGRFVGAFDDWLNGMIDLERPDRIAFEAPLMLGGGETSITTTRKLMGLASHTEFVCHRRGLICREANVSRVKKFWTGTGRAKKPEMIAAARRWGHAVKDDNQADALGLWSYQVHALYADQRHRWAAGQLGAAA